MPQQKLTTNPLKTCINYYVMAITSFLIIAIVLHRSVTISCYQTISASETFLWRRKMMHRVNATKKEANLCGKPLDLHQCFLFLWILFWPVLYQRVFFQDGK